MSLKEKIKSALDKYEKVDDTLKELQNVSATKEEAVSALKSIGGSKASKFLKVISEFEPKGGAGMKGGRSFFKNLWDGLKRAFSADGLKRAFTAGTTQLFLTFDKVGLDFAEIAKDAGIAFAGAVYPAAVPLVAAAGDELKKFQDKAIEEYRTKVPSGKFSWNDMQRIALAKRKADEDIKKEAERLKKELEEKLKAKIEEDKKGKVQQQELSDKSDEAILRRGEQRDKERKRAPAGSAEWKKRNKWEVYESQDPNPPERKLKRYKEEESKIGGKYKILRKDIMKKGKGKKFPNIIASPNAAVKGEGKCGCGQSGLAGEDKNDGSKDVIPVKQINSNTSKGDNRGAMSGWAAIGQSPNASSFASVGF